MMMMMMMMKWVPAAGSCDHRNEISGSKEGREFFTM
jgi:hypothetical protein